MFNAINRIDASFRGLLVHHKERNILNMPQSGNFTLSTRNIENISYNRFTNISENKSEYRAKKDNLFLISDEGHIVMRSGFETSTLLYDLSNPNISESDDASNQGFTSNNTINLNDSLNTTESVINLRNNSMLIESLGNKSLTLYSNNGLNNIAHGNINIVSDRNTIIQSSNIVNITSLGYILFNSERMLGSIEEDISLLSATGEIKFGGNGVTDVGIKINNQEENNYLGINKFNEKAERNLHIDINEKSLSSSNNIKNGIVIDSKNINNQGSFPEITLNNYDKNTNINQTLLSSLNLGIGSDENDINNLVYVRKANNLDNTKTYLIALNNFEFTSTDVNKIITYSEDGITSDTIIAIDFTSFDEIRAEIATVNTTTENNTFSFKKGYINRDNLSYLKNSKNNDLMLGNNNLNTFNIKNNGNIGINNYNPTATLDIKNNYGVIQTIRTDNNKKYTNGSSIQMKNGNYIVIYVTELNNKYNLEGSIYNINNKFINKFDIFTDDSVIPIQFDIDNLQGIEDRFILVYSYQKSIIKTDFNIFNNLGAKIFQDTSITLNNSLDINSRPRVKTFNFNNIVNDINVNKNGFIIGYLDKFVSGENTNIITKFVIYENNLQNPYDFNINSNIINFLISERSYTNVGDIEIKSFDIEYLKSNRQFIVVFTGDFKLNNSSTFTSISMLNKINLSFNTDDNILNTLLNNTFIDFTRQSTDENIFNNNTNTNHKIVIDLHIKKTFADIFLIGYYLKNNTNETIDRLEVSKYQGNQIQNNGILSIENNLVTDININRPSISLIGKISNFYISYNSGNTVKYYRNNLGTNQVLDTSLTNINNSSLLRVENLKKEYVGTIIFYNNSSTDNLFNQNSINFKEIENLNNIVKITNSKNNIQITNEGNINVDGCLEINKEKNITEIKNNLVISSKNISESGVTGQLNYFNNNLYIYLNNNWQKITLTTV